MTAIGILIVIPFVWSAAIVALRRQRTPDDAEEKTALLLMLAPVVLGGLALLLPGWMPVHVALPVIGHMSVPPSPVPHALAAGARFDAVLWLAVGCVAVYVSGVLVKGARLWLTFARLRQVAATARRVTIAGHAVSVTPAAVPPLAWGRGTVILPDSMTEAFTAADLGLIIRHETAHLRRGDPLWFAALSWIEALLWFNPFVRAQIQRCRLAAELACDAVVAPASRETYADVLLRTLRLTSAHALSCVPAVDSCGDYRMRLTRIMTAAPARTSAHWLAAAAVVAVLPVTAAQFAWAQSAAPDPIYTSLWATDDAKIPARYKVGMLHDRLLDEARDDVWASERENLIQDKLSAAWTSDDKVLDQGVTCKATLCEVRLLFDVKGKNDTEINRTLDKFYKAEGGIVDHFQNDSSGSMTMDNTPGTKPTRLGIVFYYFRKV